MGHPLPPKRAGVKRRGRAATLAAIVRIGDSE